MPKPAVKWLTWYFPALDNGNMLSYAACECSDYFRRLLLQLSPKYSLWLQIELSKTKYEDACFIESQVTRSEQLSQQLQKELTNVKQKNKSEVWLCDGFTKRKEFNFQSSDS